MPLKHTTPTTWLSKLTLPQLRRVAFAIGAPSSGTKSVLKGQIEKELGAYEATRSRPTSKGSLSVVSIDMGIRNLAYAHLIAHAANSAADSKSMEASTILRPSLLAWKRMVISGRPYGKGASTKRDKELGSSGMIATSSQTAANGTSDLSLPPETEKEAFDPSTFADYAYNFVKSILSAHQPTHVLIERQRFRSGGASAVQEWTIRVGVFEGMLHAVLRTLSVEHSLQVVVQGVDPGRVTRYWLESRAAQEHPRVGSAKESKKAKIDIVGESLGSSEAALVDFAGSPGKDQGVVEVVDAFLARWKKKQPQDRGRKDGGTRSDVVKLDDFSDCLLQGVAWLRWQNKRLEMLQLGLKAFETDPLFASVMDGVSSGGQGKQSTTIKEHGKRGKVPR